MIQSVGALIYAKDTNRFLFVLRNGHRFDSYWGLAGGKVNKRESVGIALVREIKEEINLKVTTERIVPLDTFTSENGKFVFYTYLLVVDKEFMPKLNDEHRGYCWCYIEDHPRPLHPGLHVTFKTDDIKNKLLIAKSLSV